VSIACRNGTGAGRYLAIGSRVFIRSLCVIGGVEPLVPRIHAGDLIAGVAASNSFPRRWPAWSQLA